MTSSAPTDVAQFSVSGKTAIITGAGSGINLCFAELLLSHNCNVIFADLALRPEALELVARYEDKTKLPRAVFVQTDVTSWSALSHVLDVALTEFGDFDIVCPGAGVYEPHWSNFWHPPGSAQSKDGAADGHYALLDINLTHPIRMTQIALSQWLHPRNVPGSPFPVPAPASIHNPKRVVHISSIAGQLPVFRAPLYGASKFAISGFVRCLHALDPKVGIRVNAVAPGVVRTPLWTEHPEKLVNLNSEQDSWVTPEEVAEAMLKLVVDDKFVGGAILEVGKNNVREVQVLNDPGPDFKSPDKGHSNSNSAKGDEMVWDWLSDESIWGGQTTADTSSQLV
ncbi:putative nad-dependent 15-hydroxyprostaglandin dehydrogenase protein [Paramyrothecium foliicola]|nr:putative nad-dependent 15-hydroxyprostaglandin dehydrogenase protein [Paramyrothecium foliicola]